jgi:hypothetical protein
VGVLLVTLLTVAIAAPGGASAKPTRKKAMWGPVEVEGRSQFPIYADLGVGIYQYALNWSTVTPTRPADPRNPADPAYNWPPELDIAVAEARKYGMRVALMLIRTPAWAREQTPYRLSADRDASTIPPDDPRDFADFAAAASRRYPTVRHWMVWGEPNRGGQFAVTYFPSPAARDAGGPLSAAQKRDVQRYASLVDATYGTLKRRSRRNLVVGGMTALGDIDPRNWIRNLKLANGRPPRMDLYGHNPYGLRTPNLTNRPVRSRRGNADFSDLDTLAGWLDRYLARSGRNRRLPIFISEYNAPTDEPSFEFNYYVTRAVQARWVRAALRITRSWSRIYTLGWHSLRDLPPREEGGPPSNTGLIDKRNRRKPAYAAFKRG